MLFFLFLLIQRGIQCLLRVSCHVCLLRQRQYCSEGIGQVLASKISCSFVINLNFIMTNACKLQFFFSDFSRNQVRRKDSMLRLWWNIRHFAISLIIIFHTNNFLAFFSLIIFIDDDISRIKEEAGFSCSQCWCHFQNLITQKRVMHYMVSCNKHRTSKFVFFLPWFSLPWWVLFVLLFVNLEGFSNYTCYISQQRNLHCLWNGASKFTKASYVFAYDVNINKKQVQLLKCAYATSIVLLSQYFCQFNSNPLIPLPPLYTNGIFQVSYCFLYLYCMTITRFLFLFHYAVSKWKQWRSICWLSRKRVFGWSGKSMSSVILSIAVKSSWVAWEKNCSH